MTPIRLTQATIGVLNTLLDAEPEAPPWGFSICRDADLGSGTVYPILDRLLKVRWIESWEETTAHPGRPPRRYYALTNVGRQQARAAMDARASRRRAFLRAEPTGGLA
ncbi:PadR family transcriptional regulator [Embleya sp. NPDC059237]|uniref:PadR family transcriptional regulator n=1 Tax=Embleya sp. NPDC059237 TaxID=3346784 RepID=UPI003697A40F